jgi:phosphoserine phosphatase RsbU/P
MVPSARILLVDDYELLRTPLARYLTEAGFDVVQAADGVEALQQICVQIPDAIISDVVMPRMDGFQLRETIQCDKKLRHIPFLFLTGYDSEEEMLKGLDLEPDDFLSKSISQTVLVKKLETVIKRHRAERNAANADLADASAAAGVQLLPERPPAFNGYEIAHLYKPYKEIPGGDFYDYIRINPETLMIVLGDVQGKQWSAWMFSHAYMAYVRSAVRSLARSSAHPPTPASVLEQLNQAMCNDGKAAEVLCTLTLMQLHAHSHTILYANAAHVPALHVQPQQHTCAYIEDGGAPIGFRPDTVYVNREIELRDGEMLLLMTDGITDGDRIDEDWLGTTSLHCLAQSHRTDADVLKTLFEEAYRTVGMGGIEDDATLLSIRRTGADGGRPSQ